MGSPSHIIIHTGTNDLRVQQERVATALINVTERASTNFPTSKIILSTLLLRTDFHPDTIRSINTRVSRHCTLKPNVHLAQHPTLNLSSLYDHVHLHRRAVPIFAKSLKDTTLNRSSSTPQPPRPHLVKPSQRPLHRLNSDWTNPRTDSAPLHERHQMARPAVPPQTQGPNSQTYAEAVRSQSHSRTSTGKTQASSSELRDIQEMLTLLCSHLMGQ